MEISEVLSDKNLLSLKEEYLPHWMIFLPSHCFLLSEMMNGSFPSLLYFFFLYLLFPKLTIMFCQSERTYLQAPAKTSS
ncbi:hypothetical protein I7I48_09189 [Histoplasma ohiense]|nr:hypothetical protein I7I48_09189 [Histoplasma ohiense (nom. inval.)]